MYFILAVNGCLPYVDLIMDEDGETSVFETKEEAKKFAKETCAWDFKIVEFK